MIYNDHFVWLHFPKCAGSRIETLFENYFSNIEGLHQDLFRAKDDPTIAWHDSISKRGKRDPSFSLNNRTVICSFRKLPSWLESRYSYEYKRSPDLPHDPELLLEGRFLEIGGQINHADRYAQQFIPKTILNSGNIKFIRTEYFESDFKSVFGDYIDISRIPDTEYKHHINSSVKTIPDDISHKLNSPTRNHSIYDKCPYWKAVEEKAYSDVF